MLFKGTTEIEVLGVKHGLKFGMLASGYFCEEEGITLKQMFQRLTEPTPMTFINCIFAAARSYNESKKLPVDFDVSDVSDWIDEVGVNKISEIIFECMQVYEDKQEKNAEPREKKPGEIGE